MAFHGNESQDRYKWYQSPHLGLSPAGYSGISGGYYNHYPAYPPHTLSNFTQPNPYPPPHHHQFVQLDPYSPPQHNHSALLINGYLLPQQFPYISHSHAQPLQPPACSQPIYPVGQHPTHHSLQPNTNFCIYPLVSPVSAPPLTSHQHQIIPISDVKPVEPDHHLGSLSREPDRVHGLEGPTLNSGYSSLTPEPMNKPKESGNQLSSTRGSGELSDDKLCATRDSLKKSIDSFMSEFKEELRLLRDSWQSLTRPVENPQNSQLIRPPKSHSLLVTAPTVPPPIAEQPIVHSHLWRARCKHIVHKSTAVTGEVRKPHRLRRGIVSPRETCKYQKRKFLIRKPQFQCIVAEITQYFKADLRSQSSRVPSLLDNTVLDQSSFCLVSGIGITVPNFNFVDNGCDSDSDNIDSVLGATLSDVNENLKSGNGREWNMCGCLGVNQDDQGLNLGALHLFDEMLKSNGLCDSSSCGSSRGTKGDITWNGESEFQVSEGMDNLMRRNDAQSHFKHYSLIDGSYVGNTLLASETQSYTDVGEKLWDANIDTEDCGIQVFYPDISMWSAVLYRYCKLGQFEKAIRVLNDVIKHCFGSTLITDNGSMNEDVGKEGLFAGDGNEKRQVSSKKELDLLLVKWKARATAETQSQSKLVQWFILCLQLCHCAKKDKEIGIFCKEALHRFGEMAQTSLSQKRDRTIKLMFDGNWEIWKFWVIAAENEIGIEELHVEPLLAKLGFMFFSQKLPQSFLPSVSVLIMGGTVAGWELLHREYYTVLKSIDREALKVILVECLIFLEPWMLVVVLKAMMYTSCVKEVCASHLFCIRNVTAFDQLIEALKSTGNDQACDFGSGLLFNILPLLIKPTLEDQERHLLVKVIDKMLYELAELGLYVHKILVVIALLINDDYFARFVGKEMMTKLGITSAIILSIFLENLYAEISAGIIWNKQNVGDYLSWIFMYGKLTQNPNHYNLHEDFQCHFSDYLSELVESALSNLESSKCASKGVDIGLLPLNSVLIASHYFSSGSKTCELMLGDISTALEDILVCYYDGIMIQLLRHFSNSQSYQFVKPLTFSCLDDPHLTMILCLWEIKAKHKSMVYLFLEDSGYPTVPRFIQNLLKEAGIALGTTSHGHKLHDQVLAFSIYAYVNIEGITYDLGDNTLAALHSIDITSDNLNTSAIVLDSSLTSQPVNIADYPIATLLGSLLVFGALLICIIDFHISVSLVGRYGQVLQEISRLEDKPVL